MGHVAVAVPACLSLIFFGQHEVDAPGFHELLVELRMAADAIVHDYLGAGIFCHDGLSLAVSNEIGHVLHADHRLETIFHGEVLVRHMTIVASGAIRFVVDSPMA